MKSNNVFTYLLYALLGLLVLAAGYLALDKSKKDAQIAEERKKDYEQLNQTIKNGFVDTAETNSSAYVGESDKTKPTADKNGIEDAPDTKKTAATTSKSVTATKTPAATTKAPATTTTTAKSVPEKVPVVTKLAGKGATAPKQLAAPKNTGRYFLVVGAFSQIDNARTEMERFVKMGYRDAEVIKYTADKWRVVAKRCKTRAEAEKYEGDLARQGIDAMVVDSFKK